MPTDDQRSYDHRDHARPSRSGHVLWAGIQKRATSSASIASSARLSSATECFFLTTKRNSSNEVTKARYSSTLARPLVVAYDPYLSRTVTIESEPPPAAREAQTIVPTRSRRVSSERPTEDCSAARA